METEPIAIDSCRPPRFDPWAGWIGLVCALAIFSAIRIALLPSEQAAPEVRNHFCVDVNRATEAELMALPNLGPATAGKIVKYREQNGPFVDVNQLLRVPGIGPETLRSLRPMLIIPGEPTEDSLVRR